jgi:hypothetical protein
MVCRVELERGKSSIGQQEDARKGTHGSANQSYSHKHNHANNTTNSTNRPLVA